MDDNESKTDVSINREIMSGISGFPLYRSVTCDRAVFLFVATADAGSRRHDDG